MNNVLPLLAWNVPLFVVLPLGAIEKGRRSGWQGSFRYWISVKPLPPLLMPIRLAGSLDGVIDVVGERSAGRICVDSVVAVVGHIEGARAAQGRAASENQRRSELRPSSAR